MKRIISLNLALLLVYATLAPAEIRRVPADYTTIQAAVDDCNDGDTVLVADDIYTGQGNYNIILYRTSITVRSENGPAGCIIDCNNLGCGFSFQSSTIDANSIIDGFTIINGYGNPNGGGIECYGANDLSGGASTLTISNCNIRNNMAKPGFRAGIGGGIFMQQGNYLIHNCNISNNSATSGHGGGIYCRDYSDVTITNSAIFNNTANNGGGGIYCRDYSNVTITNSMIFNNTSDNEGGGIYCTSDSLTIANSFIIRNRSVSNSGGGIFCNESNIMLTNCTITANTANQNGGGVYCGNSFPVINNCTITANLAYGWGGGIFADGGFYLTLINSIIWGNAASYSPTISAQIYSLSSAEQNVIYNCIQDEFPDQGSVPFGDPNYHNINDNPMFVRDPNDGGDGWGDDPATPGVDEAANDDFGDLHLQTISPCINTGFPNFLGVSNSTDMDGQPRIIGCRIDMGVDEFAPMLVVTKPKGDEVWIQNSSHEINWTGYGIPGTVDVSYSSNNGDDWVTIENNVANTGSYTWQLPAAVDSNQCLVSITPGIPDPGTICIDSGIFTIKPDFIHPAVSSRWKSLGGDFDRAGLSQNYGPELGCVKWQFETTARVSGSITVGADNRIHIACEDGKLYTLNSADGSLLWTYDANSPLLSSPTVGPRGSVYVGSRDGKLHAVSIGGTLRWTRDTDGFISSSPAVSQDGNIYVCSQDGLLYALDTDGSELWTFDTDSFTTSSGSILASPTIGADGAIYIAGLYEPNLYAIDPNGESLKWTCHFDSNGWPFASPVVSEDNTIYQTLVYDTNLYAIDATAGTLLRATDLAGTVWRPSSRGSEDDYFIWYGPGDPPDPPPGYSPTGKYPYAHGWSEPALGPDGTIYVALDDAHLRAVDPNGSIKWVTRLGMVGGFTLTVGNDGLIYAAGDDGYLCVLDNTGNELARFQSDGDWLSFPVIAADNTIIISDSKDNTTMNTPPNNIVWAITADDCQGQQSLLHRPEDLSANRTVNFDDFALLAADWLSCTDENNNPIYNPYYDPAYNYVDGRVYLIGDINRNLYLDFDDLEMLANKWLSQE